MLFEQKSEPSKRQRQARKIEGKLKKHGHTCQLNVTNNGRMKIFAPQTTRTLTMHTYTRRQTYAHTCCSE